MSDEDSEDDIAAANEKMKAAAAKFAVNANSMGGVSKKKKGRAPSRGFEERKTTVRNMSKNIYKPSFNLPAKDPKEKPFKAD